MNKLSGNSSVCVCVYLCGKFFTFINRITTLKVNAIPNRISNSWAKKKKKENLNFICQHKNECDECDDGSELLNKSND